MMIDGYDVQIIGVAAAGIKETLRLQPATLGVIITAGQVGVILGALVLAPFADRIGRKWLMIASCLIFGVFSFLTAFATTVPMLIVLRVLAGIGLGSIGPAALAFGAEYAPKRLKASIPTWIWAAVPVGGMIAGFSAVWLLPIWGLRVRFIGEPRARATTTTATGRSISQYGLATDFFVQASTAPWSMEFVDGDALSRPSTAANRPSTRFHEVAGIRR